MTTYRVLVCDQIDLADLGLGAEFIVDYRPLITHEELLDSVSAYDVLIVRGRTKVGRDVLDRAGLLKVVARSGTGLDNVDVSAAHSRGIKVVNTPESLVEAVAEHVILLMLALSRRVLEADDSTRRGDWSKGRLVGSELRGKQIGIVGLGRIGRRVGEIARVIGMSVVAHDVVPIPSDVLTSLGAKLLELDSLLSTSDYVTLHVPLTEQTRHLVDARRLQLMRRSSFLINASRGGVIDENALAAALKDGRLAGAGLDVFESEPPSGDILTAPNTVLTPHVGGQTMEAQRGAVAGVSAKIREALSS